jgi:hypothetical protein
MVKNNWLSYDVQGWRAFALKKKLKLLKGDIKKRLDSSSCDLEARIKCSRDLIEKSHKKE